jgi:hypothetical protein
MNQILRLLSVLLLVIFNINCFAQQIPNNSFETWTGNEPDAWNTSNQDILGTKYNAVTMDLTNPQQGLYSAKLTVINMSIPLIGSYSLPGVLTLGKLNVDPIAQTFSLTGGYPFTGQPQKLTGYFKYQPVNNDSCVLGLGLFKWNNGKQDTLGYGGISNSATINSWTPFEIPILYLSNVTPDTINIAFLNTNPVDGINHTGTNLWIDNLSLVYGTLGIEGITFAKNLNIYAEHNARQLVLSSSFAQRENLDISLFNMAGIELRHWKRDMQQSTEHLDVNNIPTGTYIIRITSGNRLIDSRKITILN